MELARLLRLGVCSLIASGEMPIRAVWHEIQRLVCLYLNDGCDCLARMRVRERLRQRSPMNGLSQL